MLWVVLQVPRVVVLRVQLWVLHQVRHFSSCSSFWSAVITLISGNIVCEQLFDHAGFAYLRRWEVFSCCWNGLSKIHKRRLIWWRALKSIETCYLGVITQIFTIECVVIILVDFTFSSHRIQLGIGDIDLGLLNTQITSVLWWVFSCL